MTSSWYLSWYAVDPARNSDPYNHLNMRRWQTRIVSWFRVLKFNREHILLLFRRPIIFPISAQFRPWIVTLELLSAVMNI